MYSDDMENALQLLEPYGRTHPNLVHAWVKTLTYLLGNGEYSAFKSCVGQLRTNIGSIYDVGDISCVQMVLLLAINT